MTEKEVIFEGDLIKIFGERPFSKEIAESQKISTKVKTSPKEEDKSGPKDEAKDSSKDKAKDSSKDKAKDSSKEEITEENSK